MINIQKQRYDKFYKQMGLRWIFRFDIRYRCRRLQEVLSLLKIEAENLSIFEFGFGNGALLKTFSKTNSITGADLSATAIENAKSDEDFKKYKFARFIQIGERGEGYPEEKFDLILSSHCLEHTIDDEGVLKYFYEHTNSGGHLCLFVPLEEPDYIRFHNRNYSLPYIRTLCQKAGYEIVFAEGSMHINGHIWKILTIPSRRSWPVLGRCVDGLRLGSLSLLPYSVIRGCDFVLDKLSFSPRQAFIVAKKI